MTVLEAVLLGLLQGVTEFLPVSSSGHEVLGAKLLDVDIAAEQKLAWVVLTHLASALAIVVFLLIDLRNLPLFAAGQAPGERRRFVVRWGAFLALATVPAGLAFLLLRDFIDEAFNSAIAVGVALLLNGTLLFIVDRLRPDGRDRLHQLPVLSRGGLRVLLVGVAQAIAIVPGISRSGSTISAALFGGLERAEAVRFSFCLGLIAIVGATVLKHRELLELESTLGTGPMVAGFVASFIASLACLWLLVALVRGMRLRVFAVYCWVVGAAALVWSVVNGHG